MTLDVLCLDRAIRCSIPRTMSTAPMAAHRMENISIICPGANANAEDHNNDTVLYLAMDKVNIDSVRNLLASGANANTTGGPKNYTALIHTITRNCYFEEPGM